MNRTTALQKGQFLFEKGKRMELAEYKVLEQIINITEMTNKWMRWCEQSLPSQSVFAPSVFQMRDAYSHFITMFANGIVEQGLEEGASENCKFDEVSFFKSDNVKSQFSLIFGHILRAYFDTADYIIESLCEVFKNDALNPEGESFLLLRNILNKYDAEVSDLRAQKSQTPCDSYDDAVKWDALLQIITSAYSFSDYERDIYDLHRTVMNAVLDIERNFEADVIKEYDPDFYKKKIELASLRKMPSEYEKYINSAGKSMENVLENPGEWQQNIIKQFNATQDKLKEYLKEYQLLMETIPSTALIRKLKGEQNQVKNWALGLISIVFSLIATTWIGQKLFLSNQTQAVQLDYIFLVKICLLFVFVELILIGIWHILRKIGSWSTKK